MTKTEKTGLNGTLHPDMPPRGGTSTACTGQGCKGGRDDAVSSVVALMLLLAVIATFISLYATSYVPGLKEQSEIDQITSVKEAFIESSNDIGHIASEKIPASYGHLIPLGAGDILMSPEKSSGTLTVTDLGAFAEIRTEPSGTPNATCGMVSIAFEPSYTFWEDQGYTWQYGYINVTKKGKTVPLTEFTMQDVLAGGKFSTFAESFIAFDDKGAFNASSGKEDLSSLTIDLVNIMPGTPSFASGNSPTNLQISACVSETSPINTHYLNFTFTNSTNTIKTEFSKHPENKTEVYLRGLCRDYNATMQKKPGEVNGHDVITLDFDNSTPPVAVTIRTVNISVSAS